MTTTAYDKAIERLELSTKMVNNLSDNLCMASFKFFNSHADKATKCGYLLKLAFIDLNGLAMDTLSYASRQDFMFVDIKSGLNEVYNADNVNGILELAAELGREEAKRQYDWNNKVKYWGKRLNEYA